MKARKIFSSLLLLLAPGLLCPGWSQADYLTERWASFAYIFYQLDTVTGSPAIGVDGSIYARTEHDYVFALRRNGKVKWTSTSADGNSFRCSPAIAPSGDIIIHTSVRLYAHNPEDGSVKCTAYPDGGNIFEGAPAISKEGTVYIGSQSSNSTGGDNLQGAKLYAFNPSGTIATKLWAYEVPFPPAAFGTVHIFDPVIDMHGTIYVMAQILIPGQTTFRLYAINPNGTFKTFREFDEDIPPYSPAIGPDGTIYVASRNHLYALKPDDLSDRWKSPLTAGDPNGSPVIGYPVASWENYSIVVPCHGGLECIGGKWAGHYGFFQTDPGFAPATPAIDKSGYVFFGTHAQSAPYQGQLCMIVLGQYEAILIEKISRDAGILSSPAIVKIGDHSVIYLCEDHSISAWNNNVGGLEQFGLALTSWPCDRGNLKRDGRVNPTFQAIMALAEMMISVQHFHFPQGITKSLTAKLESAGQSLEKQGLIPARNRLDAFINEVRAIEGKKIPAKEAAVLIADAQEIVRILQ